MSDWSSDVCSSDLVAQRMYPGLNPEGAEFWMGSRPSTPDSLPVIDRASRASNVIYAFGHGHTGLTGAPMTAEIVAALAADGKPPVDPQPYGLARFRCLPRQPTSEERRLGENGGQK